MILYIYIDIFVWYHQPTYTEAFETLKLLNFLLPTRDTNHSSVIPDTKTDMKNSIHPPFARWLVSAG